MNMVIDPEFAVTAPEAVELRRNVLEILVDMLPHDLGLWYGGVKEAYRELILVDPLQMDQVLQLLKNHVVRNQCGIVLLLINLFIH